MKSPTKCLAFSYLSVSVSLLSIYLIYLYMYSQSSYFHIIGLNNLIQQFNENLLLDIK